MRKESISVSNFVKCLSTLVIGILSVQLSAQQIENSKIFDIQGINGIYFNRSYLGPLPYDGELVNIDLNVLPQIDSAIFKYIQELNSRMLVQQDGKSCPVIHEVWEEYKRQCFAYVDHDGDTIVSLQYLYKPMIFENMSGWDRHWLNVYGSCSMIWRIEYNLSDNSVTNFDIN